MTEKVNPSPFRPAEAFKTAGAIALAGGSENGWISSPSDTSAISEQDSSITDADLNAFEATTSSSSLDVTIDGGEAFVYGSWLAKDTDTSVTLDASTADQTVYVGWNKNVDNGVIIGLDAAFASEPDDTDERIPLYSFDTDGSGVTNTEDLRTMGKRLTAQQVSILRTIESDDVVRILPERGMIASGNDFTVNGELVVDGSFTTTGSIVGTGTIRGSGTIEVL